MKNKPFVEKAVEEFEKEFVSRPFEPDGDWSWSEKASPFNMKSFLRSKLSEQREEILKMLPKKKDTSEDFGEWKNGERNGFNQALEEIKSIIEKI